MPIIIAPVFTIVPIIVSFISVCRIFKASNLTAFQMLRLKCMRIILIQKSQKKMIYASIDVKTNFNI